MSTTVLIVVGAIFLFVFAISWAAFEEMGLNGVSRTAAAGCVALLAVIGLVDQPRAGDGGLMPALLIPYAVLGLTLLLLLLLPFLILIGHRKDHRKARNIRRSGDDSVNKRVEKRRSHERH